MARRLDRQWIVQIATVALCTAGCERCFPGLVGEGVARLTIRNAGAIVELINADTKCGFESPAVKYNPTLSGTVGREGSATWTVTQCDIDLSRAPRIVTDCKGNEQRLSGIVRVSGTRTIGGTLSGDRENPVVPGGPDAVLIDLDEVEFSNFAVDTSEDENVLTMRSGKLAFKARPRLARSLENGVCMIPTPNIKISDIVYERANLNVRTDARNFEVPVPTSNLWAVNGVHGTAENALSGRLRVWEDEVDIAPSDGLNPEYDASRFGESFECTDDLAQPVSFECEGVGPKLAQGAARLTVRTFGMLVDRLDKDAACGFSSPAALAAMTVNGAIGGMGSAEIKVTDCALDLDLAKKDCIGTETKIRGRVVVSGSKILEGRLTGDAREPVVPMKDGPASIVITSARFDDFVVSSAGTGLRVGKGGLSGTIHPRVARDKTRGACSVETGIARFEDLAWTDAEVEVTSPSGVFATTLERSSLRAVNGSWGGDTNMLRGKIVLANEVYDLPTDPADDGLDPEFDPARFAAGWQCGDALLPPSFDCHFDKPLAQGAAQLAIKVLGTLAPALEANTTCGFASPAARAGTRLEGAVGDEGRAIVEVTAPCEMRFAPRTPIETDCNGVTTYIEGVARVSGSKAIRGRLTGNDVDPAVPTSRDAVELAVDARFEGLRVWMEPGEHAIELNAGTLSGIIRPRLALDAKRGACAIPTPVATMEGVRYADADLRITSEGKTFDVHIDRSYLEAQNGKNRGVENYLAGVITIDGQELDVPVDGGAPILDPAYDPARFETSYTCKPNYEAVQNDGQCRQRLIKTIGEGAARLIVQSLGTVTKLVNEDGDCGFESNLTDPDRVVGRAGELGQIEWSVRRCDMTRRADRVDRPISTDCVGNGTYTAGKVVVDGRRVVRGIREDINILFLRFYSIKPNTRESVDVFLDNVSFQDFLAYEKPTNMGTARRALTIHAGFMTAHVTPILGENSGSRGTFDVPTPIARLANIELRSAPITLMNEGMTFKVFVDSASLNAFNGSYRGSRNSIAGHIIVEGQRIDLPPQDLDPDYDQQSFDRKYACTRDLRSIVPAF